MEFFRWSQITDIPLLHPQEPIFHIVPRDFLCVLNSTHCRCPIWHKLQTRSFKRASLTCSHLQKCIRAIPLEEISFSHDNIAIHILPIEERTRVLLMYFGSKLGVLMIDLSTSNFVAIFCTSFQNYFSSEFLSLIMSRIII